MPVVVRVLSMQDARAQSSNQGTAAAGAHEAKALDAQQQQQQPAAAVQQQQQLQQLQGSLHEQALYQLPPDGQPLPPLPRFRARRPEQRPMPILQALALVQVRGCCWRLCRLLLALHHCRMCVCLWCTTP